MRFTWVAFGCLICLGAALVGCRTLPPEVKPPKQPEVLSDPPAEARYDRSLYPKEAFATPDLFNKKRNTENMLMPARNAGMPGMMMNQAGRGPY